MFNTVTYQEMVDRVRDHIRSNQNRKLIGTLEGDKPLTAFEASFVLSIALGVPKGIILGDLIK